MERINFQKIEKKWQKRFSKEKNYIIKKVRNFIV